MPKPVTCKHCQAINKHYSAWCLMKPLTVKAQKLRDKPRKPIVTKPCTECGSMYHTKALCPANRKAISQRGKKAERWYAYKVQWMKDHEGEEKHCWICGSYLPDDMVSLDHVIPRSRRPDLVFEDSNIKPACLFCNIDKGSRVL